MKKKYANKGLKRNKKPLKNKIYKFEVKQLKEGVDVTEFEEYKFKDKGYLVLYWKFQGSSNFSFHGFITPEKTKELLGEKQWSKFCQGKREFIIQRRLNGKNI